MDVEKKAWQEKDEEELKKLFDAEERTKKKKEWEKSLEEVSHKVIEDEEACKSNESRKAKENEKC